MFLALALSLLERAVAIAVMLFGFSISDTYIESLTVFCLLLFRFESSHAFIAVSSIVREGADAFTILKLSFRERVVRLTIDLLGTVR
jgi:hypothetical protein